MPGTRPARIALLTAALAATSVFAQAPPPAPPTDPALAAADAWIGRALILRGFYTGGELEYDATGHVKGSPKGTDWTLAGMDIDKVTRRPTGELVLEGPRVAISWNTGAHTFDRHPLKEQRLKIVATVAPNPAAINTELAAIFSVGIDPALQRSMPPYWSHYFMPAQPWPADELTTQPVLTLATKPPADLVYPVAEKKPEPDMTPEARAAHIKGTLQAVLVVDAEGNPRHIRIRQPLGWGLDAKTADVLARYRFKPGTQGGKPMPIEVIINQGFDFITPPAQ